MFRNNLSHVYARLLVTPALILMGLFTHIPSFTTLVSSFFSTGTKKFPSQFIGLENYELAIDDPIFVEAVLNNVWYAFATIIPSVFLAILMAIFVDNKISYPSKAILFSETDNFLIIWSLSRAFSSCSSRTNL